MGERDGMRNPKAEGPKFEELKTEGGDNRPGDYDYD